MIQLALNFDGYLALSKVQSSGTNWVEVGALAAILQFVVLAIAGVFGYLQLNQVRLARNSQYRPFVVVYCQLVESAQWLFEIVVENIGAIPARNVKFKFTPELKSTIGRGQVAATPQWAALNKGIGTLAPGQKITHLFDSLESRSDGSELPSEYQVSITSEGGYAKEAERYLEDSSIDIGAWIGAGFKIVYGIHDVAKSLDAIVNQMKHWTEIDGVRVYDQGLSDMRESRALRRDATIRRLEDQRLSEGSAEESN
jgi:hypothetical protein